MAKQSRGKCIFCDKEMTNGGLTKHLQACHKRKEMIEQTKKGKSQSLYYLKIQNAYLKNFWLHLEVKGSATLKDLDQYLRDIWLECCGHMSSFMTLGSQDEDELPMNLKINRLNPDVKLTHIYDFGTETETLITITDVRKGIPLTKHPIYLMARNDIPETFCVECGKPSKWYCEECLVEEETWNTFCDKHAKTHPHDNYGEPIEIVNSPRLGVCGYTGPAVPPY
ncbi:MAG: hypothetical protein KAG43_05090 [Candidatus Marithrix sp.]|nr:hypothetical protein [Candidatus Marithrix sp.]